MLLLLPPAAAVDGDRDRRDEGALYRAKLLLLLLLTVLLPVLVEGPLPKYGLTLMSSSRGVVGYMGHSLGLADATDDTSLDVRLRTNPGGGGGDDGDATCC